ncbi:hypothetical protein [uncultured Streptococcus sp.]|uniref:hypothetical protein n=1 Tax=uncultured Streptococcus sp. TaxID=83427 RepID=UPI0028EFD3BD|nr:hypothetical protein [uncultured Streptococcus sp.]
MEKQSQLQILIHSLYNNKEISLTEEFRKQLLETAKQFSSTNEDLLAARLSFAVSKELLSFKGEPPTELLDLAKFVQKKEAKYKQGIVWSGIFKTLFIIEYGMNIA